ncbi:MAG: uncharacterized protein QOD06_1388 [Candidatus Binatota bacterium]|jgi:endogenous inhibitor of DNA gyrase (YacG/DUF329 family)|nr:uncharacterized protein [Candidatus Binatota bacterium]
MALLRVRCPTCRRESEWQDNPYRPFCSERCRLLDLGNWAAERYRIAVEVDTDDPDDPVAVESEEEE